MTDAERIADLEATLGKPLRRSDELNALSAQVAAMPKPTEQEIIDGGVAFIMGPGGDEGTRARDSFPSIEDRKHER